MTHSPAPWTLAPACVVVAADGRRVCNVPVRLDPSDVDDCLLIAASPELLEALVDTLECAEQLMMRLSPDWDGTALEGSSIFKARAAIAKATGAGA